MQVSVPLMPELHAIHLEKSDEEKTNNNIAF